MDKIFGFFVALVGLGFGGWIFAQGYVKEAILQDRLEQTQKSLEHTEIEYDGYQQGVKDSR